MGVTGDVVFNLTEIVAAFPEEIAINFNILISILKAIGVVVIFYVIYMIVMMVINFRRIKRDKFIEKKVKVIEKKLDLLLKKSKSKKN